MTMTTGVLSVAANNIVLGALEVAADNSITVATSDVIWASGL